ncbi:hypothetical protein BKA65DRAFT_560358 [Rhexocercosporidium sp. MPI-PUGE-AT-0058]|nr:hypothetical protein BKA65DRAFT_560358 [Rhexocercosporidium sp. MPI-PUGE-AT-0058]
MPHGFSFDSPGNLSIAPPARQPAVALRLPAPPNLTNPQEIVTIKVKPEKDSTPTDLMPSQKMIKSYTIHKAFLLHYSPYFRVILKLLPRSPKPMDLEIDNTHITAFGIFVHWLYYQTLTSLEDVPNSFVLMKVWELGGRFRVPALQNSAMDSLHEYFVSNNNTMINTSSPRGWYWEGFFGVARRADVDGALMRLLRDVLVTTKNEDVSTAMIEHADPYMIKGAFIRMKKREIDSNVCGVGPASDYYVSVPALEN